ncbi:thioester dehydrase [Pseudomonadota bacterium]|uniref:ApeI family dehydratase n=1 Tax=unclassified Shewanella TaxID=196818 RepID=UPI0026E349C1|nr:MULTISPECIES: thioester dehydrase [unclassified Shewanella]MDO6618474.1 thioester dehydrase [Shewanella sp. 6_MG-2023]MDO6640291.1 thioester dehydrase [Shewanella sp. 5_MG-2023]
MKIKSTLPQIISQTSTDDGISWQLFVAAELDFFKGHFDEQPVLPGVTQLDWAIQLGSNAFGYEPTVATLEVLKFQQLLLPNSHVELFISHNAAKAKLTFVYRDADKRFASGRIAFDTSKIKPRLHSEKDS